MGVFVIEFFEPMEIINKIIITKQYFNDFEKMLNIVYLENEEFISNYYERKV